MKRHPRKAIWTHFVKLALAQLVVITALSNAAAEAQIEKATLNEGKYSEIELAEPAVHGCLESCLFLMIDRKEWTCSPIYRFDKSCGLDSFDPLQPNAAPEKPELCQPQPFFPAEVAEWRLSESRSLVTTTMSARENCSLHFFPRTSSSSWPPTGRPPRDCNQETGPWKQTIDDIIELQPVSCQE